MSDSAHTLDSVAKNALTRAERQILWEQFVEVHAKVQESYDSSVRALAGGGVGITVSLATALHSLSGTGIAAVALFLASLGSNVLSYATAQMDMRTRTEDLRTGRYERIEGNNWTKGTTALNVIAGITLLAGGVLLAAFVATTTSNGGGFHGW